MNKLSKTLLVAAGVALVVSVGVVSVNHYNQYKTKQDVAQKAVVAQQAKEKKELTDLKAAHVALINKYNLNRIECEKGVGAYDLLLPAAKAKTPRPLCGSVAVL